MNYQKHTTYIYIPASCKEPIKVEFEDSEYGSPTSSLTALKAAISFMEKTHSTMGRVFFLDSLEQYENNPRPKYWEGEKYENLVYWAGRQEQYQRNGYMEPTYWANFR